MFTNKKFNSTFGHELLLFIAFTLLILLFPVSAEAQCAMCRAALESEGNKGKAEAVNDGIVYLMIIPYLLVGTIAFYIYRLRQKKRI
ncbi:MAG TPA: hypothetical protein VGB44_08545 [Flavobacterium sp.]|jgi:hypothetical protein